MTTKTVLFAGVAAAVLTTMPVGAQQAVSPENATLPEMPKQTTRTGKHVNRIIDMWLKGQPVYYAQISGGGYEEGKQLAATKADYITYEMEHGPLDFKELREFMRGLLEVGPDPHRPQDPGGDRDLAHFRHDRRLARQWLDDPAGACHRRARHPAVQRREPGSRPAHDRSLAVPVRAARRRPGPRHARERLSRATPRECGG